MKTRLQSLKWITLAVVTLALVTAVVMRVYAATVVIDNFNSGRISLTVDPDTHIDSSYTDSTYQSGYTLSSGDALGDERDAWAKWVSGGGSITLRIDRYDSNRFVYSAESSVTGYGKVVWDGDDNDGTAVATHGLDSVDLLSSGPANDGLRLAVLGCDHNTVLTFTVYEDSSTDYWDQNLSIVGDGSVSRVDIIFPYSGFTLHGTDIDWTDVGALVFDVNGTIAADLDLTIDYMDAVSGLREYGDLPSGYGTSILGGNHIPQGLKLGHNTDAESTYNANSTAQGDDGNDYDDEDGVTINTVGWSRGTGGGTVAISVYGCGSDCYINGWIDWNKDSDFDDTVGEASEHIISDVHKTTSDGENNYTFKTPLGGFFNGTFFARFRVCKTSGVCNTVTAANVLNGEVEDYSFTWSPLGVSLSSFTATPQGNAILVTWETAAELNNAGFNLYRGASAEGPWTRLNESLIAPQYPGQVLGGVYEWLDETAAPGVLYYYRLEDVDTDGGRTFYDPVSAVVGGLQPHYTVYLPFVSKP